MSDELPPDTPAINQHEVVMATIVDAVTGKVRRHVYCPRFALAAQVQADESIVEGLIERGQKWDHAAKTKVRDDPPPPPVESGATWNEGEWRWITKTEKNFPIQLQIDALEKKQFRSMRELLIGRGGAAADLRQRLQDIDDQITALRAQME